MRRVLVWFGVACVTAFVFAVALIVAMPATALRQFIALPAQIEGLSGTIWRGSARLTDGYVLDWDSGFGGLILARLAADVTLQGPDTLLTGQMTISPWRISVSDVAGRAGPGLLALAPDLVVSDCTSRATVQPVNASFGGGTATAGGQIDLTAGTCADFAGDPVAVPAVTLTLSTVGNDAVASLAGADGALAQVTVAGDRRLLIRVEPAGARLVPGMPSSGPTMLEYPF